MLLSRTHTYVLHALHTETTGYNDVHNKNVVGEKGFNNNTNNGEKDEERTGNITRKLHFGQSRLMIVGGKW